MAASWQTVRVFISSTFRDMQAERDHLVKVVFPALRERLEAYRVHLIDIDLRWGVTKEQAENDQALDLCLQQIDECRPFFIGLLGERYGWVPQTFPDDALAHYGWIQHHTGKSVTELEMLYGVLTNPHMQDHAFFYLRDPAVLSDIPEAIQQEIYRETDYERMRLLAELKGQIRDSGFPVMEPYPAQWDPTLEDRVNKVQGRVSGLHEFGKAVEQQLWKGIQARLALPEHPPTETLAERDPLAEEQDYHERYMESRLRVYVGRETLEEQLLTYATEESTVPCLVTGPSGSGKSAALAHFASNLQRTAPDTLVIPHFIGASPGSTSLRQMLRRFCLILKDKCGFDEEVPHDPNELVTQFRTWIGQVPETEKLVFVIDALNQLDETDNAHAMYWLPREIPTQVKMVVSCIDDPEKKDRVLEAFAHLLHERINLEPLTPDEQRDIVRQVPSLSAKTLDATQIDLLLANPATANPLFLLVGLEELRGFGSFEELNARIAAFPQDGDTVTALFTQVIDRLTEEFDEGVVRKCLALLACSREGLSQRELLELIEGEGIEDSTSDLFPILRQLRPYLQYRGALLDFYHRNLFKSVRMYYLPDEESTRSTHKNLADYFHRIADPVEDGSWSSQSPRGLSVLPYHLIQGRHWDQLNTTLLDFRFLRAKLQTLGIYLLIKDYDSAEGVSRGKPTDNIDRARTLVGETLRLAGHVLISEPAQLPSQLHGRLLNQDCLQIRNLLQQAVEWTATPWLRPCTKSLPPPGDCLLRTIECKALVNAVAVTLDGQRLIAAVDHTVQVWDLASGYECQPLIGHAGWISALAVTPDGRLAITGSSDHTVKVWDLVRGAELQTLRGHFGLVAAVAVTEDGRRLITGSYDGTLKVWDLARGKELQTLIAHDHGIWGMAVTPDGRRVLTGADDGTVKVWDLVRGEEVWILTGHAGCVKAVAVTPDGRLAITGSYDHTVKVWDLVRGAELQTLVGHFGWVSAVAVTPDGRLAITGSYDHTVKVWNLARGEELQTLKGNSEVIQALALMPDYQQVITGSLDGTVKFWDIAYGEAAIAGHTRMVLAVVVTPDEQRVVTVSEDHTVKVWDLVRGAELQTLIGYTGRVSAVAVTPDGKHVITAVENIVTVWDLATGVEFRTLRGNTYIEAMGVTSDGQRVFTGLRDGSVKVWDLVRGVEAFTLRGHTGWVSAVAVTPDGQRIVTGSADHTVKVWDLVGGAELQTLRGHTEGIRDVAVMLDGQRAVTRSLDRSVKVWDLVRGEELRTLRGPTEGIECVAVTLDGQRAITGSWDRTVKMWNLAKGTAIVSFRGESGIGSCAVSLDGLSIIVGEQSGRVHFLRLENV